MFLHGFWDSATFLPGATDTIRSRGSVVIYLIGIVCAIAVLRQEPGHLRRLTLGTSGTACSASRMSRGRALGVELMGIEPTTPCLQSRCSSQLSYSPES